LTELAKLKYNGWIREQLERQGITEIPCLQYAKITFTLIVPNFKCPDPDNLSGMVKPVLDAMTVRAGGVGLIPDDSGKFMEITYQIRRNEHKRSPWLQVTLEECPTPPSIKISPVGTTEYMAW